MDVLSTGSLGMEIDYCSSLMMDHGVKSIARSGRWPGKVGFETVVVAVRMSEAHKGVVLTSDSSHPWPPPEQAAPG